MRLAIICGGNSVEHEVSLQSAVSIAENIDLLKYQLIMVGMTKSGRFVTHDNLILDKGDPQNIHLNPEAQEVNFGFRSIGSQTCDVAFPIIHGSYGEDGNLQGFLNSYQIPFVGADIKTSAVAMDKHLTKLILKSQNIAVTDFVVLYRHKTPPSYQDIASKLGTILCVKPSSLGSSVGVSKCDDEISFRAALTKAFKYDQKILVESFVLGREIEIGVLGHPGELIISKASEIITSDSFYSYRAKYLNANNTETIVPAELSNLEYSTLKSLTSSIYEILDCRGLARVDFFLSQELGFVFNEINTLPGFTNISMYPKMMIASDIPYPELLDRLVTLALYYGKAR